MVRHELNMISEVTTHRSRRLKQRISSGFCENSSWVPIEQNSFRAVAGESGYRLFKDITLVGLLLFSP